MKFSIIVPVYNISKYIEKCIQSIINQVYINFEIIIVDDGSSDDSGKICDLLQEKNSDKIKVIHQSNQGLSQARNAGIKMACGDYLMFVDGDDFLKDKFVLQKLNTVLIQYKYDIIQYNMLYYYEKNSKYLELKELENLESKNDIISILNKLNMTNQISISACDKIVSSKIIKDNNLLFKKDIYSEDIDWSLRLYMLSKSIYVLNDNFYVYRQQRTGSITNKVSRKNMIDLYNIINYWYNYNYDSVEYKNLYYNYIAYQLLILITKSKKKMFTTNQLSNINKIKNILLEYNQSTKVKLFNKVRKFFGYNISVFLMRIYLCLKNKGIIKI